MRWSRPWAGLATVLLVAGGLAASSASAPGLAQVAPRAAPAAQSRDPAALPAMGATDLFAALTGTDRSAEIDALRTIRRALANADDPRSRDSARDQVESLLAQEERRQPDIPPALVLSSLATRIDSAVAALEQARGAPAEPKDEPSGAAAAARFILARWQLAACVAAALLALAAGAGAGLAAALLARRGAEETLASCGEALAAATARLDAASASVRAAQGSVAPALAEAEDAARDSALAVARLSAATLDAEMRLRDCLDAVDMRHGKAAALAAECERLARSVPEVFAGAIDMVEARGLPAIDAVAQRLQAVAEPLAASGAALPAALQELNASAARLDAAAASHAPDWAAALDRTDCIVSALQDAAARLQAGAASLEFRDETALPTEDASEIAVPHAGMAALEAVLAQADGLASLLPELTSRLAETAADLRRDAQGNARDMVQAADALKLAAGTLQAAGGGAVESIRALQAASAAQLEAGTEAGARIAAESARLVALAAEFSDHADASAALGAGHAAKLHALLERGTTALEALPAAATRVTETLREAAEVTLPYGLAAIQDATEALRAASAALPDGDAVLAQIEPCSAVFAELASVLPARIAALGAVADDVRESGAGLAAAARTRAAADQETALAMASTAAQWPRATTALTHMAVDIGNELAGAVGEISDAAAALSRQSQEQQDVLAALAVRSGQAAAALPAEAAQLVQAALGLRQEAACLNDAAQHCMVASARETEAPAMEVLALHIAAAADRLECTLAAPRPLDAGWQELRSTLAAQAELAGLSAGRIENALADMQARMRPGPDSNTEARLLQVEQAAARALEAAGRVAASVDAQAQAAANALRAAQALAPSPPAPTLPWLADLASQIGSLQRVAGGMAEAASRGGAADLPPDLAANLPALLDNIERSVRGLRGTATALAMASDAARAAA
jgi:hypothetical protein